MHDMRISKKIRVKCGNSKMKTIISLHTEKYINKYWEIQWDYKVEKKIGGAIKIVDRIG